MLKALLAFNSKTTSSIRELLVITADNVTINYGDEIPTTFTANYSTPTWIREGKKECK